MTLADWNIVESLPPLNPDEVHLWRIDLGDDDALLSAISPILSPEEQARAQRRLPGRVRAEFVIGRTCLRLLLGHATGVDPASLKLREDSFGKPVLEGDRAASISFNVSHSHGLILIAISSQSYVGIDIEFLGRTTDIDALLPSVLGPAETAWWSSLPSIEEKRRAFYQLWTRKEAWVKAEGQGLSIELTALDVTGEVERWVKVGVDGKCFFLSDITVEDRIAGAIAVVSPNCRIRMYDFPLSVLRPLLYK
ncbi:MAG: 4'-phosphopantetheinyl transferase superfamily protein [Edaphobacter sp.]|uniref:4'-phosphopantetheinyl transferase family protein n=1 Tax=Edaphobacter sp. TaxID=1934404 RepID=UPI0023828FD7|nr:4'-phosphopantetheinyl transferase superfamily protein [Edaphobacter sp.]MDE1175182.1 4'-phosphopantetheinyl transferase superfamily protein [Edaphobacter sp.]